MAGSKQPEKGDEVSWNWGGGAPGGTVAETKTEGEIAIKSKRGNTIKKKADPENPAVHIQRSGNDVVKRASELTVEKKKKGGGGKRKAEDDQGQEDSHEAGGEDHDDDGTAEPHTKNKQGKEVKKGGKGAKKKQKREQEANGNQQAEAETDDEVNAPNGDSPSGDDPSGDEANTGDESEGGQEKPNTAPKNGRSANNAGRKKATNEKKYAGKGKKDAAVYNSKTRSAEETPKANDKAKRDPAPSKQRDPVSTRTRSQGSRGGG